MPARLLVFILVVLLLMGFLTWWGLQDHGGPPGGGGGEKLQISQERLAELLALHKRGVAEAENDHKETAIEIFEEVAAALPDEPAPLRNIVIVRMIDNESKATPESLSLLEEAIARWEPLETDRAIYSRLLARHYTTQRNFEAALEALHAAIDLDPDDPTLWFELGYKLPLATFKDEFKRDAPAAIAEAYELAPGNIIIATQHAIYQTAAQDPAVVDTLTSLEELVRPTRDWLEEKLAPVDEFFAELRAMAAAGDWQGLNRHLEGFWNVAKGHDQQHSDLNRMDRHLLEFIDADFAPELMEQIPVVVGSITTDVDVSFSAGAARIEQENIRDLALTDVNLDGRLDLCLLAGNALQIHWGAEDAGWTAGPVVELNGEFNSLSAQDMDDDKEYEFEQTVINPANDLPNIVRTADIDFVLTGPGGVIGLRTNLNAETRECTFEIVDLNSLFEAPHECGGVVAGDFDSDGDMDLLLDTAAGTTMLWNTERWKFDVQSSETYSLPDGFRWTHADIADIDRDVDIDIVLSSNDGALGYLEGLRHHAFRWRELLAAGETTPGSVAIVDIDGNASWDVLAAGESELQLISSQTLGRGDIVWESALDAADVSATSLVTWDYDNDSRTDVLAWNSDGVHVLRGSDQGLVDGSAVDQSAWSDVREAAAGDFDLDGDLDAVVADAAGVTTLLNEGGDNNRWIDLLFTSERAEGGVQGVASKRVNNNAIGSLLEIRADGVYQAHIIRGQRTHIGLGNAKDIEIIRAIWTNGAPENYLDAEPLQVLAERQTIITSCPYLYTWNGSEYVWVTDLLWAAPLGLPDPAGGLLPERHWEYIRIPGEMLAADDGMYRLEMTEELWEASYVDEVRLFAVDHPADVDIHINEKVGPAEIAEHHIYTVSDPRVPVAALNQRGEDVLSEIAAEDDQYLKLHEWRHMQGYPEDTTLELDLGEFDADAELVLFLSGWIRPADANLHVRLQQDESLPGPQAPRIEIPDGQGGWRELIGYMGFPNGKTKTIAVPLPNEFVDGDHRIRIATSMELYWDHIFFTVNEPDVEVVETQLSLVAADLHYRGVSALVPHPNYGPERYDYSQVATEPRFTAMDGKFTRFGDVLDLMTTIDNRLVVFYCGDEITLEFAVPDETLPEGWVRDFVLYNVGWEKDCNINGVLCKTTEPYPFVGMSSYPYPPDEFPWTEEYQAYLDEYQTRELDHLPYLRFVHRFDPDSPDAANPTIVGDLP